MASVRRPVERVRLLAPDAPAEASTAARSLAGVAAMAILVTVVGFVLRVSYLDRAYEVFFDEGVYLQISQHVAQSFDVTYDRTVPFFLHPPLFFFIEAAYLHVVHPGGDFIAQVLGVRGLNAGFGAASAGVIYLLVRRLAGGAAGFLAAMVFAIEPFILRIDSRNLLEPSAMFWALLGLWALAGIADRPFAWKRSVLVGLAFAAAVLTNEPSAFVTLAPLAICAVFQFGIPRKACIVAIATALSLYSIYPLVAIVTGNWAEFYDQKLRGLLRFIGSIQLSGFNAHRGPSFQQAVSDHIHDFLTTYALMAAGALAIAYLITRRDALSRIVLVWVGCAYVLQAYSITIGTNEEQYFYYLVVLAIVADVYAAFTLLKSLHSRGFTRGFSRMSLTAGLVFLLGWAGAIWPEQHLTRDDAYRRVFDVLEKQAPPGTTVAGTSSTDFAMLNGQGYHFIDAKTPKSVVDTHSSYVIVSTNDVKKGFTRVSPALLAWLKQNAVVVTIQTGPTTGQLTLYRIPTK